MTPLELFRQVEQNPGAWLKQWKAKSGKKVIGCFPLYVPEELIHAAGLHPVCLQGSDKPIALANQYLHSNLCHPMMGTVDQVLRGELDYLDGLVVADICEQAKRGASVLRIFHQLPMQHHLIFPKALDQKAARGLLVSELHRFQRCLETTAGKAVTATALRRSIVLYNRTRRLLSQLYTQRRKNPACFSAAEVSAVIAAAMVMPKEEFNPLLSDYLVAKSNTSPCGDDRVPVLLAANPCEDLEPGLPQVVDEAGATVVDDDLYFGYRYFAVPVSTKGDPLEALAEAHLSLPACPTRHHDERDWASHIIARARQAGARGVVLLLQKFCEIHAFEYPFLRDKFKEAGMPLLLLESDHSGATGRVKTRLEAFLEMVKEA